MLVGLGSHEMTDDDRAMVGRSAAWIAIVAFSRGRWPVCSRSTVRGGVRHRVPRCRCIAMPPRAPLTLVTSSWRQRHPTRRANAVAAQPTKSIGDRLQQVRAGNAIPVLLGLMLAIITHADIAVLQAMRESPISGAAVGSASASARRRRWRFWLTMFLNARLGVWKGNPAKRRRSQLARRWAAARRERRFSRAVRPEERRQSVRLSVRRRALRGISASPR